MVGTWDSVGRWWWLDARIVCSTSLSYIPSVRLWRKRRPSGLDLQINSHGSPYSKFHWLSSVHSLPHSWLLCHLMSCGLWSVRSTGEWVPCPQCPSPYSSWPLLARYLLSSCLLCLFAVLGAWHSLITIESILNSGFTFHLWLLIYKGNTFNPSSIYSSVHRLLSTDLSLSQTD